MREWIKSHKGLFAIIIILTALVLIGTLLYFFYFRPKWQNEKDAAESNKQEFVAVQAPPPAPVRTTPLPLGTSGVKPQTIRKMPRPSMAKTTDRDVAKQDLRNPGVVADMQASQDDGYDNTATASLPAPPRGGNLEDMFAGDGLPQDAQYPEVTPS